MDASVKIQHLQQKISVLQEKQQALLQKRSRRIITFITKHELTAIEASVLMGALIPSKT